VADREQVDDAWSMMEALREALDRIDEEVCGTEPPAAPAPAPVSAESSPVVGS
jgi:hypothetical protein